MLRKFFYSLLGLLLLPALAATCFSLYDLLVLLQERAEPAPFFCFLGGLLLWLLSLVVMPAPFRSYVLGHELTHAIFAWIMGERVKNLRVDHDGGSVEVSGTNLLISLSPYFLPFYTTVLFLLYAGLHLFVDPSPWYPAMAIALGYTWAHHLTFTSLTLSRSQTDLKPYGVIFSFPLITIVNLWIVLLCIVLVTSIGIDQTWVIITDDLAAGYKTCWQWISSNDLFQAIFQPIVRFINTSTA